MRHHFTSRPCDSHGGILQIVEGECEKECLDVQEVDQGGPLEEIVFKNCIREIRSGATDALAVADMLALDFRLVVGVDVRLRVAHAVMLALAVARPAELTKLIGVAVRAVA